jgi:hypothetical protein
MTFARISNRLAAVILGAVLAVPFLTAQPALADGSIVIRDFVLTNGIYEREPVGTTESFASSDELGYAFARIANDGDPTQVSFVWYFGDEMHATIDMNIGTSSGWRTWSSVNLRPGNWQIKLKDASGTVIVERSFTVEHASGMSSTSGTNSQSSSSSSSS